MILKPSDTPALIDVVEAKRAFIERLPLELLVQLLGLLPVQDVTQLSTVSFPLYQATKQNILWYRLCVRDYNLQHNHTTALGAEHFYKQFLHPYGGLIGLSKRCSAPYGGLLKVELNGLALKAWAVQPPVYPFINQPTVETPLFTIAYKADRDCVPVLTCTLGPEPHACVIKRCKGDKYKIYCTQPKEHTHDQVIPLFSNNSNLELVQNRRQELLRKHHDLAFQYEKITHTIAMTCSTNAEQVRSLLPGGCFVGDFRADGFEFVMLSYEKKWGKDAMNVTKITGDKYLGADTLFIESNLQYSIDCTDFIQSHNLNTITSMANIGCSLKNQTTFNETPYQQPSYFYCVQELPKTYRAAYKATIALRYTRGCPSTAMGAWILFDKDTFAFLWMKEQKLVMFRRADLKREEEETIEN